jgi:hypothetical protein
MVSDIPTLWHGICRAMAQVPELTKCQSLSIFTNVKPGEKQGEKQGKGRLILLNAVFPL